MKRYFKGVAKALLAPFRNVRSQEFYPGKVFHDERLLSFSQFGEDLVLDAFMGMPATGFYVDIGANDPLKLSNTHRFYLRGWHGINVEPDPLTFLRMETLRPRDINLNVGIASKSGTLDFYRMSADSLSTFNRDAAFKAQSQYRERIVDIVPIQVRPLADVLSKYASNLDIDFLSVDVEGLDLEVLQSNDWNLHRPKLIVVEVNQGGKAIDHFLQTISYAMLYNNGTNGIYSDTRYTRI